MTLKKRGKHRYGDAQADTREELTRYAALNGYPAHHFADAVCVCGWHAFALIHHLAFTHHRQTNM